MFGLGLSEILVLLILALIILGPKQLPEAIKYFSKTIVKFKRTTNDLKNNFNEELEKVSGGELQELKKFKQQVEQKVSEIRYNQIPEFMEHYNRDLQLDQHKQINSKSKNKQKTIAKNSKKLIKKTPNKAAKKEVTKKNSTSLNKVAKSNTLKKIK